MTKKPPCFHCGYSRYRRVKHILSKWLCVDAMSCKARAIKRKTVAR